MWAYFGAQFECPNQAIGDEKEFPNSKGIELYWVTDM